MGVLNYFPFMIEGSINKNNTCVLLPDASLIIKRIIYLAAVAEGE